MLQDWITEVEFDRLPESDQLRYRWCEDKQQFYLLSRSNYIMYPVRNPKSSYRANQAEAFYNGRWR